MASSASSTPSSQPPKKYDVFISFSGEESCYNFISLLHDALCRNQIDTHIDYRLKKGDGVWPSLEKTIQDSTLFIVIFSEKYASFLRCLKELSKILECSKNEGRLVMPVYYRVDPSHVRKQLGSYQHAFEEHEHKSINKQQLQKWRENLAHAANLFSWDCSFDRNEMELITEIVKCVVQTLGSMYQSKDDLKGKTGIHERMAYIESLTCPLKSMSSELIKVENLVQIEMPNSNLTKLWDGVQDLVNLSKIKLDGSKDLIELPNLSKAKKLEVVNLNYCSKLQSVHPSILSLHSLCHLWLRDCKALTSLTSNTHLKSLIDLDLTGCSRLTQFLVTSENRRFQLNLSRTAINDYLCSSSGSLIKIDSLVLDRCKSVTSLHKLVDLRNLRYLSASCCNKLASNLRSIFDEMRALQGLELIDCSELFEVPDNISLLSSLRALRLSRTNIDTLPLSIKHLRSLQDLFLDGCERLHSLPELPPSVSTLCTTNCLSLGTFHLPLTNEGRVYVDYDGAEVEPFPFFSFTNCMKLDQQSIKAAEAKLLLEIGRGIFNWAVMDYPGERVPEWFMYRTPQSFVTVDLSWIPQSWDNDGLIFCAVISESSVTKYVDATWFVDGQYACDAESSLGSNEFTLSDHVFLWYDSHSSAEIQRKIKEKKKEAQSNTYHPLVEIKFTVQGCNCKPDDCGRIEEIIECGVCPTSAPEVKDFINSIIAIGYVHPQSQPHSIGSARIGFS